MTYTLLRVLLGESETRVTSNGEIPKTNCVTNTQVTCYCD